MDACWHVLHTKPHKEDFLRQQLAAREIRAYCPHIRVHVVNPRARKVKPYFPGYLFINVDLKQISPLTLQRIPGASHLVSFGGEPAFVPDSLIDAIRKHEAVIEEAGGAQVDGLRQGEVVVIKAGPFAGFEAIFNNRISGSERVRIFLKLLQSRQLTVELPTAQIERKKQPSYLLR
jgi:transcription elongation factor/antiterminator RfaH